MIRSPRQAPLGDGPELTPLIDIVFIVVVFLLLTANAQLLSLPVELPDTDSPLQDMTLRAEPITVAIKATSPHWIIDVQDRGTDQFEDWEDFKDSLLRLSRESDRHFQVTPEADASSEKLLQVLALFNAHKITDVQILMEPKS